jgi:hypothetical protein
MLQCNNTGSLMFNLDTANKAADDWRALAAAWLLPLLFAALIGAAHAMASGHHDSARECGLAGAVIPEHDPSLPGPDEIKASDWLEQVRAAAYSGM